MRNESYCTCVFKYLEKAHDQCCLKGYSGDYENVWKGGSYFKDSEEFFKSGDACVRVESKEGEVFRVDVGLRRVW